MLVQIYLDGLAGVWASWRDLWPSGGVGVDRMEVVVMVGGWVVCGGAGGGGYRNMRWHTRMGLPVTVQVSRAAAKRGLSGLR